MSTPGTLSRTTSSPAWRASFSPSARCSRCRSRRTASRPNIRSTKSTRAGRFAGAGPQPHSDVVWLLGTQGCTLSLQKTWTGPSAFRFAGMRFADSAARGMNRPPAVTQRSYKCCALVVCNVSRVNCRYRPFITAEISLSDLAASGSAVGSGPGIQVEAERAQRAKAEALLERYLALGNDREEFFELTTPLFVSDEEVFRLMVPGYAVSDFQERFECSWKHVVCIGCGGQVGCTRLPETSSIMCIAGDAENFQPCSSLKPLGMWVQAHRVLCITPLALCGPDVRTCSGCRPWRTCPRRTRRAWSS